MTTGDLAELRREYARATLDESTVDPDPIRQFGRWFDEAVRAELPEANAMTLATATRSGVPSARIVLLKGVDLRGFVFYTDRRSQKGRDLTDNPRAALVFHWVVLERQGRIAGAVTRVSDEESDAYFKTRPEGSRVSAWASHQGAPVPDRTSLDAAWQATAKRFPGGEIPRPPYWGGYRVAPEVVEFWQGRPSRYHDRILYRRRADGQWSIERLSP